MNILATLMEKFPPSSACDCKICKEYCKRPGWWTVDQAKTVMEKGYAERMMMEISPKFDFAVLSPAFYGCEGLIATQEMSVNGCNFLKNSFCELHDTVFLPLECAFCHHERIGQGNICHRAIEDDWNTYYGQNLVKRWQKKVKFQERLELFYKKIK